MDIGRRLYYDNTGKVLWNTGERTGNVIEVEASQERDIYGLPVNAPYIELDYGYRLVEFQNAGSLYVNPVTQELTIYPLIAIAVDKEQIVADGIDTAIITTSHTPAYFSVNDSEEYLVDGTFQFASTLVGKYTIKARTELNGSASITVEVV